MRPTRGRAPTSRASTRTSRRRPASADNERARLSPNLLAALVLFILIAGVLLWQRPWSGGKTDEGRALPEDASAQLDSTLRALSDAQSRDEFIAAADVDADSRRFAEDAWDARESLGVDDVELRLVGGGAVADRSDGTATAQVRASWTVRKDSVVAGTTVRDAEVRMRVAAGPGGTLSLRTVDPAADPLPLWLAGRIAVEQLSDARIVRIDGGDADVDVARLVDRAARTVRSTLPDEDLVNDATLTVVSPATARTASAVLGRSEDDLSRVAAVPAPRGGTRGPPRRGVRQPPRVDTMDERAAQVVVTHEAVHQLTGVIGTEVETWVAEGFADWVALRDDDAPLALSAGQALRQVQEEGPPARLPTKEDFASAEHGVGALYEAVWMVFRMLGEQGVADEDIIAFHRAVVEGTEVATAAQRYLGDSLGGITGRWQDYLTKSASTLS